MRLGTLLLPALKDNYIHMVYDISSRDALVIDPADASVVLEALETHKLHLSYILNTHHHGDHVGGNKELKKKTHATIIGYKQDAHRIPLIDRLVEEFEELHLLGALIKVIALPGHTLGHIAYFFDQEHWLYCGDVLFGMGCGRLFEGTHEQMFNSLSKIKQFPSDTKIYCGHEYTQDNGQFARHVYPQNDAIKKRMENVIAQCKAGYATVPLQLAEELVTNPFLLASDIKEFTRLRMLKDEF